MKRFKHFLLPASALAACLSIGCDAAEQDVDLYIYGESFIEDGIPATAMADGWAITFNSFNITVRDVEIGDTPVVTEHTLDLTAKSGGEGHLLKQSTAAEGAKFHYTIAGMQVQGQAVQGARTINFDWTFDQVTHYHDCEAPPEDSPERYEITVHADHLFFNSLVAEEPTLHFEPLAAADANADGTLTLDELTGVDIGAYDPGNNQVPDLRAWLVAQSLLIGHAQGEGHCHTGDHDHSHD